MLFFRVGQRNGLRYLTIPPIADQFTLSLALGRNGSGIGMHCNVTPSTRYCRHPDAAAPGISFGPRRAPGLRGKQALSAELTSIFSDSCAPGFRPGCSGTYARDGHVGNQPEAVSGGMDERDASPQSSIWRPITRVAGCCGPS